MGLKKEDMVKKVQEMRDFKFQKTKVEETILNQGHRVMFIPKFHCKLNPIERVWGHAKHYTRSHCDYSFPNLYSFRFCKCRTHQKVFQEGQRVPQSIQRGKYIRKGNAKKFKEIQKPSQGRVSESTDP